MIENDTQNSRQAASTVFHNALKLAKIAQAGIQGGPVGAAAEAAVQYRKEVLVVAIAVLLLPVLVLIMLPGAIFGTLTQPSTAVNDGLEIAANVIQLRNAVSDILQEAYEDALAEMESERASLTYSDVVDSVGGHVSYNAFQLISMYSAYQGEDDYLLSEEVCFTVLETGKIQKVTMYDAPAHSLILTKRDIATNAKLADARLTIRDAYGTTIDRWTTTDGDHAIRVLPECSAAKDPHKNLLLLSDDTSEHVYTMVEELAPNSYLVAESITFKVMQMNDDLVVFVWQDGGWQKSSEGYLAMYDERTDTPVPLMKTFPQTGSIL